MKVIINSIVGAFNEQKAVVGGLSPGTVNLREGTFSALVKGVKDVKDARRRRGEVNIDAEAVSRLDHVRSSSSVALR